MVSGSHAVARESDVERYLRWSVEARLGGNTYKFAAPGHRGVADRVVCIPGGDVWFIELKRERGGVVSGPQRLFADEMQNLGCNYALLKSRKEIDTWIEERLRCASTSTKRPTGCTSTTTR